MNPIVSIVIVNYRTPSMLRACLESIADVPPKCSYEVIVVDNGSRDKSVAMMEDHFLSDPHIRLVVRDANKGYAAGANEGFRHARGLYSLLINPDITFERESVDRMIEFMDAHPHVGVVAPRLLNPNGTVQHTTFNFPSFAIALYRRTPLGKLPHARKQLRSYFMQDEPHDRALPVDWVLGAAMMLRMSALEKVGMMDERYFMYAEDLDWCRTFWTRGFEVWYLPSATLYHLHERASAQVPWYRGIFSRLTRWHIQSWMKYFRKWKGQKIPRTRTH